LNNLAQSAILAEENGSKIQEVLEELESAKSSGSGLFDELTEFLAEAKVQTAEVVAGVKSSAEAACSGANTKITNFLSDIEDEKTAAVEAKDAALEAQSTAEETDSAIQKLLAELGKKSEAAQQQIETSNQALDQKTNELKEATSLLQKARADLNRQGLADSFAKHANKLTESRRKLDFGFYWALGIGACYVVACAWIGKESTPVQWLQKLSPLGILIWIGYSLASRSNVLSRLIEDYEFKAATALAFQGYRLEMDAQPELLSKLLDKAIRNFGSNPTRLMPQAKSHHAHPVEGVVERGTALVKETVDSAKTWKK